MEKRRFGRTGHDSTVAIFGAAALWEVSQAEADRAVEQIMAAGVNHIDVAPSYGRAEELLGPWMPRIRDDFFLGCKTMERTREGAAAELRRSLELLRVDRFDLYQLHAVTNMEELDEAMGPGSALEAAIEAREEGLTDYIGITGHGVESPAVFLEALRRFDFDTVLFPINFVQYANPAYREAAEELINLCRERDAGTMIIKAIARGPWNEGHKSYDTWYEPFDEAEMIQQGIDFALSQDVTGICTAGDVRLLPLCLQACENHRPMSREQQEELIGRAAAYEPLFA